MRCLSRYRFAKSSYAGDIMNTNATLEVYNMSLSLHVLFTCLVLLTFVLQFVFVWSKDKESISYIKRPMFLAPSYYLFLTCVFFTGILNMAFDKFEFSLRIFLMIILWFMFLISGIYGHILLKSLRKYKNFEVYRKKMSIKFFLEIFLIIIAYLSWS